MVVAGCKAADVGRDFEAAVGVFRSLALFVAPPLFSSCLFVATSCCLDVFFLLNNLIVITMLEVQL
jgi:hypothetical protein